MRLSDLKPGQSGVIVKILGHGAFRKRVIEMGFVRGRTVKVVLQAPLNDPVKYSILGYEVGLRKSEAKLIEVVPTNADGSTETPGEHITKTDPERHNASHDLEGEAERLQRHITVALLGNPNCGKTSLFNHLTGAHEHVGNYSGVTVDATSGACHYRGYDFSIVDLPGTYSLASYSPEERYVRKYLREETPDVIINVADSTNLERNMFLTTEIIDMDRSTVVALNMYDELRRTGTKVNCKLLGELLGVPIVPTVSKSGEGLERLLDAVIEVYEGTDPVVRHIHVPLGPEIEKAVTVLKDEIKRDADAGHHISPRYIAIKLLEGDQETENYIKDTFHDTKLLDERDKLARQVAEKLGDDISADIAAEKYGFIAGALAETTVKGHVNVTTPTSIIDAFVTNKLFGFPLFFGLMFCMFWLTFALGQYPMDWIQWCVDELSIVVNNWFPAGPVKDLVADGIIGGVGGVIVFLPNILILYFCISFMEDSGYMARAAFIMDKVMHRIGLHGKSFIPLVMGFGCNVPAILATRTIESRSSRIITILINPFMSCSARLPIYVLLIGTFFADHAAVVFMCLYCLGIVAAVVTAKLLRKFWFKKDETPFVMELPPYRMPSLKTLGEHTWAKGEQYLKKMGGIILVASVIVWALNYFPRHEVEPQNVVRTSSAIDMSHDSFLEMAGKAINPVMRPLGFEWRATVAALAGVPAKEIVVSTLGVLYTGDEAVSDTSLSHRLTAINPHTGQPDFTPAVALAFLVFILLYCPCVATITAIVRETGKWQYALFSAVYNTALAWCVAFVVYRIALLFA